MNLNGLLNYLKSYFLFIMSLMLVLSGCSKKSDDLIVGITEGPHAIIMENIKGYLSDNGVNVTIVTFSDFNIPNRSLADGDIDINIFQHQPFLDDQIKSHGYPIKSLVGTILLPIGMYSKSIKDISELREGDVITISDDGTNLSRSLFLLEDLGLIKLDKAAEFPTKYDIIDNPKKLKIQEVEAPNLPRTLDSVAASVINSDWIIASGVLKVSDAIAKEKADGSPYTNLIAYNKNVSPDKMDKINKFAELYQSEFTKKFIESYFEGSLVTAW